MYIVSNLLEDTVGVVELKGLTRVTPDDMILFLFWVVLRKVEASSSRAPILGECSTIHSPPALFFF